jgi:hypothetical protein
VEHQRDERPVPHVAACGDGRHQSVLFLVGQMAGRLLLLLDQLDYLSRVTLDKPGVYRPGKVTFQGDQVSVYRGRLQPCLGL